MFGSANDDPTATGSLSSTVSSGIWAPSGNRMNGEIFAPAAMRSVVTSPTLDRSSRFVWMTAVVWTLAVALRSAARARDRATVPA